MYHNCQTILNYMTLLWMMVYRRFGTLLECSDSSIHNQICGTIDLHTQMTLTDH